MPQHCTALTPQRPNGANLIRMLATEEQTAPRRKRSRKDLDEWNTLITALEAYKQEHGDLRVPTRYTFQVPEDQRRRTRKSAGA